jgi:hypothetical protein
MVGAKQFAIMRKIIEDKKTNPIVKSISMPKEIRGEAEFGSHAGSFLDKLDVKPKTSNLKRKLESNHRELPDLFNLLDSVPMFAHMTSISKAKQITEPEESKIDIPDAFIDHITCQVFQKIKNYLDRDLEKPIGNRQIKLEISL